MNQAWLHAAALAMNLITWAGLIIAAGSTAADQRRSRWWVWEPKTLRARMLSIAGIVVRHARRVTLRFDAALAPLRAPGTRPVPDQDPGLILWPPLAPRTVTAAPIHISNQGHGTWFTRHQHPPETRRPRHQPPPPSRAVKKPGERKGLTCIFNLVPPSPPRPNRRSPIKLLNHEIHRGEDFS